MEDVDGVKIRNWGFLSAQVEGLGDAALVVCFVDMTG